MKKISHESPLSLLKLSRKYNDYDYALVHLFDELPEYLAFFKESISMGRHVILDNSIFELGTAFDSDEFAKWILELTPSEYIIPDALENIDQTLNKFWNWLNKYGDLPGKKIGVIQGKNYAELKHCYKSMEPYCDKIAISFDYSYYRDIIMSHNIPYNWMKGRRMLINLLLKDGIINTHKPHHLLGASLPQEFLHYKNPTYNFIETIDTSNPIVHGLHNIHYDAEGLTDKLSIKLVDLIHSIPDPEQTITIMQNIDKFKKFVN